MYHVVILELPRLLSHSGVEVMKLCPILQKVMYNVPCCHLGASQTVEPLRCGSDEAVSNCEGTL